MIRIAAFILAISLFVAGCGNYTREQAKRDISTIDSAIVQIDAEVAKLPEGDPVRTAYLKQRANLAKARDIAEGLEKAWDGDTSTLQAATASIPYAGLVIALGGLAFREIGRYRTSKALRQTVQGLDVVGVTPEQKVSLDAAQDESSKAVVNSLRLPSAQTAVAGVTEK